MNSYQARILSRLRKEIEHLQIPETESLLKEFDVILDAHYKKMRGEGPQ